MVRYLPHTYGGIGSNTALVVFRLGGENEISLFFVCAVTIFVVAQIFRSGLKFEKDVNVKKVVKTRKCLPGPGPSQ